MPTVGECIAGRYRLECPLGEGGMGSVWRARHLELDVAIAVKFQHAHRARSKGAAARFRKEARAAARLKSANVVRVLDFGIDGDVQYLAMELLEGESLRARLERQTMCSVEEVLELTRQAASALDAAHEAGIVHRDFKPSNLFLVRSGEREIVKLLDFGIAKWFEGEASGDATATDDNVVVGSAHYMSPEQARGESVDPRSDVWSLAVVAYQMLTGVDPFRGANIPDTLYRICSCRYESPSRVVSPTYAPFDMVFSRAFELDPELRYASAVEFATALTGAGRQLLASTPSPPSAVPAGGWTFGREGETRSVPVVRERRSSRIAGPSLGLTAAVVLVAIAVVVPGVVPGRERTSPAAGTHAPAAAPPAKAARLAPARASVELALPAAMDDAARTKVLGESSSAAKAKPGAQESRLARRPRRLASETPVVSRSTGLSEAQPRTGALAPHPRSVPNAVSAPDEPTHVDPVFGLEVPTRR